MKRLTNILSIALILLVMVSFVSAQMPITLPFYIRIVDLIDVFVTTHTDGYTLVWDDTTGGYIEASATLIDYLVKVDAASTAGYLGAC